MPTSIIHFVNNNCPKTKDPKKFVDEYIDNLSKQQIMCEHCHTRHGCNSAKNIHTLTEQERRHVEMD
jgi:hypothetical protein